MTTYSVTVDQKLPWKMNIEASYVGNSSLYFQPQINVNAIPLGAMQLGFTCAIQSNCRPLASSHIVPTRITRTFMSENTAGKARFDSLQMSLQRTSGFLTLMVNYTYSKSLSDG